MDEYLVLTEADGAVVGCVVCPPGLALYQGAEHHRAVPVSPEQWRRMEATPLAWRVGPDGPELRPILSPAISASRIRADGLAECVVEGLPDPCTLRISGPDAWGPAELLGGRLVLVATKPGAYRLHVTAGGRYRPWEAVIHAD